MKHHEIGGGRYQPAARKRSSIRARGPLVGTVVIAALALTGCSAASETTSSPTTTAATTKTLTKVTLAESPTSASVYTKVAEQQGYFAKNGLDVNDIDAANLALLPAAVAAGQYDFAVTVAPLFLSARSKNLPVVASAGGAMEGAKAHDVDVMVPSSSSIKSLTGLSGKKVGTAAIQGNQSLCTQWALKKKGVDPTTMSLTVVPFPDMEAQLQSNLVDAALMEPPQSTALIGHGFRSLGDPCLSIGLPQAGAFLMSNQKWAGSNSKTIKAMQTSIEEAGQWMEKNKGKMPKLVASWAGIPLSIAKAYTVPQIVGGPPAKADMEHWSKVLVSLGTLQTAPDLSNAFAR